MSIRMIEVIGKNDPRASSTEMRNSINEGVHEIFSRKTSKFILKEELPEGANPLSARFVLAIKSKADGQVKYKARCVIGGHPDYKKHYMVHGA